MITLEHVGFGYGQHEVLRDISLTLRAGEVTCLLGSSGCGKTTLLKLLAGLERPQTGKMHSEVVQPSAGIGFMAQNAGLLPWRNVFDNVALGFELMGQKTDTLRVPKLLMQMGLSEHAYAMPETLSGGQQQRVALARQLVLQPKILLLDEPLGALDVVLRHELAQLIRERVKFDNIAALVVTHQPDDALFIADRICVLAGKPAHLTHEWQVGRDIHVETGFTTLVTALQEVAHV